MKIEITDLPPDKIVKVSVTITPMEEEKPDENNSQPVSTCGFHIAGTDYDE